MIRFSFVYQNSPCVELLISHGTYTNPEDKYVAEFADFEDAAKFCVGYIKMVESSDE
jgi:hypothetical protein